MAMINAAFIRNTECATAAIAAGFSVNTPDEDGDRALETAAAYGHAEVVSFLLAAGADVHVGEDCAIQWAVQQGDAEMTDILIAAGADLHAIDDLALRMAAFYAHAEVTRLLLAAGADPIVAWEKTDEKSRKLFMTTLDACGDALTEAQRTALLAAAAADDFVKLRAAAASASTHQTLRR